MRTALRLTIWLLLACFQAQPVLAAFDDSQAWFDDLSIDDREATQADLLLLGHCDFLVDGQFGRGTFDAITSFQRSQGRPDTGVLTAPERASLNELAAKVNDRLGIAPVNDAAGHVDMFIPTALLTKREPTDAGTSYASNDGEFSLETMHASLTEQSFADLYASVLKPDADRVISYQSFSDTRFVVTGTVGKYSFYTMFLAAGGEAVGYSLAWGKGYSNEGAITSVYLASHFSPVGSIAPGEGDKTSATDLPPDQQSAFRLPKDERDVIILNADITAATPAEFDKALKARPQARIVVLNSPGGAVDSALAMARQIRRLGLSTYVPRDMGCYSACSYIFFAGVDREADGELGVHQISADVADLVLAQTTLGDLLDALEEFGVKHQVISHMLRTPPEDMYVFSPHELREYGINHGPPITVKVAMDDPAESVPSVARTDGPAFVQLSSLTSVAEATRSLGYAQNHWGSLFGGARLEIETDDLGAKGVVYRVRLPTESVERANTICTAIKSGGGGCYVMSTGS
ncbi:peptidoglycan-binding protein [Devosia sp.]|uniref:peptidoglycan-binding protein n=1 Tax=Devosia sp. TaxID=1871048 RepID=UPI003BACFC9C